MLRVRGFEKILEDIKSIDPDLYEKIYKAYVVGGKDAAREVIYRELREMGYNDKAIEAFVKVYRSEAN